MASDHPLGSHAPQILATEHWSLLAARTLIWNEAMSRANVFLTVLSAAIIALALLSDATGLGRQTTTVAPVLLPVVLLLGVATYVRQVQINNEEFKLVLAMNRLRNAYLKHEPGLEPYLTTGHHDDERGLGLVATYMLDHPSRRWLLVHFMINTPTIVATVDAAWRLPSPCWSCRPPGRPRLRWWPRGGGVPRSLGRTDAAAAAHRGSAPPRAAEVPHAVPPSRCSRAPLYLPGRTSTGARPSARPPTPSGELTG